MSSSLGHQFIIVALHLSVFKAPISTCVSGRRGCPVLAELMRRRRGRANWAEPAASFPGRHRHAVGGLDGLHEDARQVSCLAGSVFSV
jgi:hypothetical protein